MVDRLGNKLPKIHIFASISVAMDMDRTEDNYININRCNRCTGVHQVSMLAETKLSMVAAVNRDKDLRRIPATTTNSSINNRSINNHAITNSNNSKALTFEATMLGRLPRLAIALQPNNVSAPVPM